MDLFSSDDDKEGDDLNYVWDQEMKLEPNERIKFAENAKKAKELREKNKRKEDKLGRKKRKKNKKKGK